MPASGEGFDVEPATIASASAPLASAGAAGSATATAEGYLRSDAPLV